MEIASACVGQGPLAVLATIVAAKPLWDTYHVMAKKKIRGGEAETALAYTRLMCVVLDSLPQLAAQALFFVSIDTGAGRLWVILGSIAGCTLSISYLVATTELDIDTSLKFRTDWPSVHGYIPTDNSIRQGFVVLGIVLFIGGYLLSKLVALVILMSETSFLVAIGLCFIEALALFVARFLAEGGRWQFHISGVDTLLPSMILHGFFYVAMLAAPFPATRCLRATKP